MLHLPYHRLGGLLSHVSFFINNLSVYILCASYRCHIRLTSVLAFSMIRVVVQQNASKSKDLKVKKTKVKQLQIFALYLSLRI